MLSRKLRNNSDVTAVPSSRLGGAAVKSARFFSGRLIIFICLLLLIGFLFITPIANYFSQQAEISRQEEILRQVRQEKEELIGLRERQGDEEYVKQQARQRLRMAVPGETPYIVVGHVPEDEQQGEASVRGDKAAGKGSWSQKVLDSVARNVERR